MASVSSPLPRHLWAKSSPDGGQGESLARHIVAVASVLRQVAARSPRLPELAEDPRLWHRAFWACWLHDLGKAARAFQAYLRDRRGPWEHRHEVLSLAFLGLVTPPETSDFAWIASAIAAHHRDAPLILERRYDPRLPPEDLDLDGMIAEIDDATISGICEWAGESGSAWIENIGLGAIGVERAAAGRLPSEPPTFRRQAPEAIREALTAYYRVWQAQKTAPPGDALRRQSVLLRGLVLLSDRLASAHAPRLPSLSLPDAPELMRRANVADRPLWSHQERAADTAGSVVLSAPTGSGKTEAALLWARRQLADNDGSPKLIYLLPYQASSNAMRVRLSRELETDVGLLHGRSVQVLYRELAEQGYTGKAAERSARRANDLARLHHPPVWVATPYQLLRAAYRLPGYEATWASIADSLIVIDEPHAYEPERLGLILGLLRELVSRWGVRVCAMSATLPTWLKRQLEQNLNALALPVDRDLFARFRRHRLRIVPGEITGNSVIRHIAREVNAGHSVLVAVNTIARAQAMHTILADALGLERVRLLHSRFAGRDRLRKEGEIGSRLQAGGTPGEAVAVVATQVIEVSLDIDFDGIFTEPAPLEALAQRFGRVNRRGRKGDNGVVPVHVMSEPLDGQGVYDARLVTRALDVLRAVDGDLLDEAALSDYLDRVYAGVLEGEYTSDVERNRREFEESCLQSLWAFESDEGLADQFDRLFDGTEVLPAGLEAEYRSIYEHSVLDAQGLLVPVAHRYIRWHRPVIRWNSEFRVHVVDLPYDPDLGLQG